MALVLTTRALLVLVQASYQIQIQYTTRVVDSSNRKHSSVLIFFV